MSIGNLMGTLASKHGNCGGAGRTSTSGECKVRASRTRDAASAVWQPGWRAIYAKAARRAFRAALKIHQRGVQWKQGVVVYMMSYTSLLHNATQSTAPPFAEYPCSAKRPLGGGRPPCEPARRWRRHAGDQNRCDICSELHR